MIYFNDNEPYVCDWLDNLYPDAAVDRRDIASVSGAGLWYFTRCHFFAGIGGWEYALALSGWPDDEVVWTASLPCQPFSAAGQRRGEADERHLWPEFRRLVALCRPPVIFGEQVASRLGREWLAGVRADLEDLGYAVGAADLCAASVGAPHIRQRLFWVAERMDDALRNGRERSGVAEHADEPSPCGIQPDGSGTRGFWDGAIWLPCLDGKARRTQPGLCPLAHGIPARASKLRAYGNAIVPQVAAVFVRAYMESRCHA